MAEPVSAIAAPIRRATIDTLRRRTIARERSAASQVPLQRLKT